MFWYLPISLKLVNIVGFLPNCCLCAYCICGTGTDMNRCMYSMNTEWLCRFLEMMQVDLCTVETYCIVVNIIIIIISYNNNHIIKISYSPNWPFKWFSLKIKNPSSWSKSFLQHLLFSLGLELCSQMYGKICISPILFLLWSWHFRFSVGARGFRAASVVFMFMKPTTDVKCVGFLFFIYPIGIFCLLAQVGCLQGFFSYKTIILLLT